jgi:hypothetical protein
MPIIQMGDHHARVVECADARLDEPVVGCQECARLLRGPDDDVLVELELSARAAQRAGEDTGLERRHAEVAIELAAPGRGVGLDEQAQDAVTDVVSGGSAVRRAPVGEVVGDPSRSVEGRGVEVVLELDLERSSIDGLGGRHARSLRWTPP